MVRLARLAHLPFRQELSSPFEQGAGPAGSEVGESLSPSFEQRQKIAVGAAEAISELAEWHVQPKATLDELAERLESSRPAVSAAVSRMGSHTLLRCAAVA